MATEIVDRESMLRHVARSLSVHLVDADRSALRRSTVIRAQYIAPLETIEIDDDSIADDVTGAMMDACERVALWGRSRAFRELVWSSAFDLDAMLAPDSLCSDEYESCERLMHMTLLLHEVLASKLAQLERSRRERCL